MTAASQDPASESATQCDNQEMMEDSAASETPNGAVLRDALIRSQADVDMLDLPSQQASPAKSKVKAKGRGRVLAKAKAKVAKPTGRGRRQKAYESVKAQAAHERLQEIKTAWTSLTRLAKPALQKLADRSLKTLTADPTAHEQVLEAVVCHEFLDQRLAGAVQEAGDVLKTDVNLQRFMSESGQQIVKDSFRSKFHEAECDMYDALLLRLDRLEYLHDNGLPVDLPDNSYTYKDITQDQLDRQGIYVEIVHGVERPFGSLKFSKLQEKAHWLPPKTNLKRKAVADLDGQSIPKQAKEEDPILELAHNVGGLLSAVEDVEGRPPTPVDGVSSSQTPTGDATGMVPAAAEIGDVEEINGLPIPRAAGLPDEHGFRFISRKATKASDFPNNRIFGPASIVWDEDEIGFRDSTNNPQKGATKTRRGMYLGKTNSHAFYYDRRCRAWYAHEQDEEDMDQELVRKHKLHPSLGFFLPTSVNEDEPLKRKPPGDRPVVFVGPRGQILHASRSVWGSRLDTGSERVLRKSAVQSALQVFCEQSGIAQEDIEPSQKDREDHRRAVLLTHSIDPDTVPDVGDQLQGSLEPPQQKVEPELPSPSEPGGDDDVFTASLKQLLQAALELEGEEGGEGGVKKDKEEAKEGREGDGENGKAGGGEDEEKQDEAEGEDVAVDGGKGEKDQGEGEEEEGEARQASRTASSQTPSRPYDAIRDVFTDSAPPHHHPHPHSHPPLAAPSARPAMADTYNLSFLADIAGDQVPDGNQANYDPAASQTEISMIDPRLVPQSAAGSHDGTMGSNISQLGGYAHRNEHQQPSAQSQWFPQEQAQLREPSRSNNDFLRTALNPQPSPYPPIAPAPPASAPSTGGQSPSSSQRVSFGSAASTRGSLPSLRPVRNLLDDPQQPPEPRGSTSPMQRHGMVASNSGAYYPPAPSRPFHNGYTALEPPQMPPFQSALMPGQQLPPAQGQLVQSYPISPPTYQGSPPQPTSGPSPMFQHSQPQPSPALKQALPPQPAQPAQRNRPGSSSAASARYRKLEPAPTPAHRMLYHTAGRELRTVPFDYREAIKDYSAIEAPPRHGPTHIRGWTHNNFKQARGPVGKADPAAPEDSS